MSEKKLGTKSEKPKLSPKETERKFEEVKQCPNNRDQRGISGMYVAERKTDEENETIRFYKILKNRF